MKKIIAVLLMCVFTTACNGTTLVSNEIGIETTTITIITTKDSTEALATLSITEPDELEDHQGICVDCGIDMHRFSALVNELAYLTETVEEFIQRTQNHYRIQNVQVFRDVMNHGYELEIFEGRIEVGMGIRVDEMEFLIMQSNDEDLLKRTQQYRDDVLKIFS
jgi:hypothetical protein